MAVCGAAPLSWVLRPLLSLLPGAPAAGLAAPISHQGLIFSDDLGGFDLVPVEWIRTLEDPITVVERVTATKPSLTIRNFSRDFATASARSRCRGVGHEENRHQPDRSVWRNYQTELREVTTRHSPYGDGLSFGQNSYIGAQYTRSNFPVQRFDEPEDTPGFSVRRSARASSAEFSFIVSDMSPVSVGSYLVQIPLQPVAGPNATPVGALPPTGRRQSHDGDTGKLA